MATVAPAMSVSNAVNPSDLFSASGLVVVITGGGTGLGLAMASAIVQQHAHKVYILGRRIDALTAAVKAIDHHPPASAVVVPVQCDVSDAASLQAVVRQVEKEVGRVDVLINNAGVSGVDNRPAYEASSIEELQNALLDGKPETWANTFAINSTATVQVSAAFLTLLEQGNVKRGWEPGKMVPNGPARKRHAVEGVDENDLRLSQIITISSIAAFNRLMTIGLSYIGSKAATVAMGKAMTNLFAPWGIRYNMICPGIFPSEMTAGIPIEYSVDKIPAQRPGSFDEIASTILYTIGKGGAYLNGNVQLIDGGRLSLFPASY